MDLKEAYNRLNLEAGLAQKSEEMLLTRAHYRDEDYTDEENEERKLLAYLQRKRWRAAEAIENSDATRDELEEAYGTLEDWYMELLDDDWIYDDCSESIDAFRMILDELGKTIDDRFYSD